MLAVLINGTAVGVWLRTRPKMAELQNQRDESESARLAARVDTLEKMVDRLHAKIDQERAEHDALMAIMRHRVANSRATLKAIVMMLRVNPDKVTEALNQIESMIGEQESAEREEREAFDRARMSAAAIKVEAVA
jgi:phage shock protein A